MAAHNWSIDLETGKEAKEDQPWTSPPRTTRSWAGLVAAATRGEPLPGRRRRPAIAPRRRLEPGADPRPPSRWPGPSSTSHATSMARSRASSARRPARASARPGQLCNQGVAKMATRLRGDVDRGRQALRHHQLEDLPGRSSRTASAATSLGGGGHRDLDPGRPISSGSRPAPTGAWRWTSARSWSRSARRMARCWRRSASTRCRPGRLGCSLDNSIALYDDGGGFTTFQPQREERQVLLQDHRACRLRAVQRTSAVVGRYNCSVLPLR